MLSVRNLWRFYDRTPAVAGIDLEVAEGSVYGFIGPNGAGKTTTLKVLATLDPPDAGRVWIGGRDAHQDRDAVRRELGFMPDPFELYEDMTVEDLLRFFARAYEVGSPRERRRRVDRSLELARVAERRGQKCSELSKGWAQRVLLAKTLVHDPRVLLLDEPASGLDPAARIAFREIVLALRELGKTIVVSSHILTELAGFCDSVGIIERGRMLVSGRIEDILRRLDPRDRVELEVLGDGATAARLLEDRPGVAEVQREDGPEGTRTHRVVAVLAGPADAAGRAAIVRSLVEGGLEVCGATTRREGLEDLFLKVAGQQGDGGGGLSPEALRGMLGSADEARAKESRP